MSGFDPWAVLGVVPGAGAQEVRAAWKRLAVEFHPDKFVTASPADQARAAAHMTVVNAAYEEIRSGRARIPTGGPGFGGAAAGAATAAAGGAAGAWASGPGPASTDSEPWIAEDVFRAAETWMAQRQRRRANRRRTQVLVGVAVLVVGAGLVLFAMSRTYGYAVAWSSDGTRVEGVDCGTRFDRGATMADELRDDGRPAEAQLVEDVCGQWVEDAKLLRWPGALLGVGLLWALFFRRP